MQIIENKNNKNKSSLKIEAQKQKETQQYFKCGNNNN